MLDRDNENSKVFIIGPNRGNTLWEFIEKVEGEKMFEHSIKEMLNDEDN